ncbi:M15 family metallopeptidase [Goekera deserti]|uniref:Hydrolase n=1 Tax=Goekera deserti TaxID=2497753 RepID=A0A7K3WEU1_9ACTN|nr:M15 family metallopeptidase [Goekera deserti]NDI49009.1 hydrolase [Goekera deserti]NEL54200.1 hydrolase [Goekera deserti]
MTLCLLTALAYAPSDQAAPVAASVPPMDLTGQAVAVQADLAGSADRYRQQVQTATDLGVQLGLAQDAVREAGARLETERAVLGAYAAELYRTPAGARSPGTLVSLDDPATTVSVLHAQTLTDLRTEDRDRQVAVVELASAEVDRRLQAVSVIESRIATAQQAAEATLAASRARTAELDAGVAAQLAVLGGIPDAGAQATADQAALAAWQGYLARLHAAGVVPPAAARLADPSALPGGLSPVLDAAGDPVPGVATAIVGGRPETLLSSETVAAVSTAFSQLGRGYAPGRAGPDAYSCGGFTSTVWSQAGYSVPVGVGDQWTGGAAVPTGTLQVGDLVFSADPSGRWADVGIWLAPGTVIGASAATQQVGVRTLVDGPTAAVRVTLGPAGSPNPAPELGPGPQTECGAAVPVPGPVEPAWGGYSNGQIPPAELCPISDVHRLRCDAAAAYTSLSAAYQAWFGAPLCVTDSYRSYAAQVEAHVRKPAMTAAPGTSNHGWALAVDLCGGINDSQFDSPQYLWMLANAPRFGWFNPEWAQLGPAGEKAEPWHWEFGLLLDDPSLR